MAIEKNHHLTGKVGPTVSYQLNGKDVVRVIGIYPDPQSPAQLKNREKMRLTSRFIRAIHSIIKTGYQKTSIDYPSNEARQYLMKNCFTDVDGNPELIYENIKVARGEIQPPEETTMTVFETPNEPINSLLKTATITWKTPSAGESILKPHDEVVIVMFADSGDKGVSWSHKKIADRIDGTVSINVPKCDQPIHFWMFFYNDEAANGESRKKISDSVYLGVVSSSI